MLFRSVASGAGLTISSTGAATFSSSVTAGTEFITSGAYGFKSYFGTVAGGSFMVFSSGIYSSFDGIYQASGATRDFGIWLNGGTVNDAKFIVKNDGKIAIGSTVAVDALTITRNAADNAGGITLYNANSQGYGSALTFRVNYAGVYNTGRIHVVS